MSRTLEILLSDVSVGSSKSFTVPSFLRYELLYAHCLLDTSATVGNRWIEVQANDENDVRVFDTHAGAVVAAGQTDYHFSFLQGIYRETTFITKTLEIPIPKDFMLLPGWKLVFKDGGGAAGVPIDAAGDTLEVKAVVRRYQA